MRRKKKKGMNPLVAIVLLVVGGGFAGKTFLDMSGDAKPPADSESTEIVEVPDMEDGQDGEGATPMAGAWVDLLAKHGSFDRESEVRVAFSIVEEARQSMGVPGGETAATSYWEGSDPPELSLGVVMISSKSRRAVLGGRVVGIGDEVFGVRIRQIERDIVVAMWGARTLTYDLEDGWPREFRAEYSRRELGAAKTSEDTEGAESGAPEIADSADPVTDPAAAESKKEQNPKGQE